MASNKHYEVDLRALEATETEPTSFEELLRLGDLPGSDNPFGNRIKRGKFVNDGRATWLLDELFKDFDYQSLGYGHENSEFKLSFSFDSPILFDEIQQERFLYSFSSRLSKTPWRQRRKGAGAYFRLGQLEEGSIRGEIYAGVVAVGTLVAAYPAIKDGFREILTDATFVTQQLSTALRASKLPAPIDEERFYRTPELFIREERPKKRPKRRILLGKDD